MFHSLGMKTKRKAFLYYKEQLAAVLKQKGSSLPNVPQDLLQMDTGFWLPKRYPDLNQFCSFAFKRHWKKKNISRKSFSRLWPTAHFLAAMYQQCFL